MSNTNQDVYVDATEAMSLFTPQFSQDSISRESRFIAPFYFNHTDIYQMLVSLDIGFEHFQ